MTHTITYKFRVKDASCHKNLEKMAGSVNLVWNYCNETSAFAWKRDNRFLSGFDLNYLTAGSAKDLGLSSQTIQSIGETHAKNRSQFKMKKLKWRSAKKSLGWIPFKRQDIRIENDNVVYRKKRFRIWKSRDLPGKIRTGCFVQDARRRWYVCFVCDAPDVEQTKTGTSIGIDLGFKTQITCSDGIKYERENLTRHYEKKLAIAQRANQKRRVRNIHARIKNKRADFNHKASTEIAKRHESITVGNVSSKAMIKRGKGWAKSATDSGWFQFKEMLRYKASRHGVFFSEVNEAWSTVTCSDCGSRTGPSGLGALGVRVWNCSNCGSSHDRDVNAAMNIKHLGQGIDLCSGISTI